MISIWTGQAFSKRSPGSIEFDAGVNASSVRCDGSGRCLGRPDPSDGTCVLGDIQAGARR